MSGWQLIETAPKDGTKILAFARNPEYSPDTYIAVAEWATAKPAFGSIAGWFWPYAIRPTHWMSLPPAPAEAEMSDDRPIFQAIIHAREDAKRDLRTLAETVRTKAEERAKKRKPLTAPQRSERSGDGAAPADGER